MRRIFIPFVLGVILLMAFASSALAAPPCNDTDGDGFPSGMEYAHFHIVELAVVGGMGEGGHKPGSHQGFSLCNPSGN